MDIIKLDPTDWSEQGLFEGYQSAIWTERFLSNGDFQIKTTNILDALTNLPDKSWISLADSTEVMKVENHSIAEDEYGNMVDTITGRTFDIAVLERMIYSTWDILGGHLPFQTLQQVTEAGAVAGMLANLVTDYRLGWNGQFFQYPLVYTQDADGNNLSTIPNVVASDSSGGYGTPSYWPVTSGQLNTWIRGALTSGQVGLRNIRPSGKPLNLCKVNGSGIITRTPTDNVPYLAMDVYTGTDRSRSVIFQTINGHLIKPSYLISAQNDELCVFIGPLADGGGGLFSSQYPPFSGPVPPWITSDSYWNPAYAGLNCRLAYMDSLGGAPTDASQIAANFIAARVKFVEDNKTTSIDGSLSATAPYVYNQDYFLGDIITMQGDYNITQEYQVTEFIRSKDSTGETNYPTLVAV